MTWSGASTGEHFLASNPALPSLPASVRAKFFRNWPGVKGLPVLMAAPPIMSMSAANAGTSIAGTVTTYFDPNLFTWSGGPMVAVDGGTAQAARWLEEDSTISMMSVATDAAKVEWLIHGHLQRLRFWVNDQIITAQSGSFNANSSTWVPAQFMPNDGNTYRIVLDFGGISAMRVLRVEASDTQLGWAALAALTTDTVMQAPRVGPRVILVGDSFAESTGATDSTTGYPQLLAKLTGWNIEPCANGATGYLQSLASPVRSNARGHINDVLNNAPDMVLWAMGANDWNNFSAAAIQAEAALCYAAVTAALPNVPQIVLGPLAGTGNAHLNATWIAGRNAIKNAALAAGLPFFDPVGSGYLRGTGKVGATDGSGPADRLVSNDGTHPSQAGHTAYAYAIAALMAAALGG